MNFIIEDYNDVKGIERKSNINGFFDSFALSDIINAISVYYIVETDIIGNEYYGKPENLVQFIERDIVDNPVFSRIKELIRSIPTDKEKEQII